MSDCVKHIIIAVALLLMAATTPLSAELIYGVIQDPDGYSNVRKGPGTEYEVVDTLHNGKDIYYDLRQDSGWWKISISPHSEAIGYVHKSRIKEIEYKTFNISFTKDGETGFISYVDKWGFYFITPDTCHDKWLAAYKSVRQDRIDSTGKRVLTNKLNENIGFRYFSKDSIEVEKWSFYLNKSLDDFDGRRSITLCHAVSRLPIYIDSSNMAYEMITKSLPVVYNPVPHKPLFSSYFNNHYQDLLDGKLGPINISKEMYDERHNDYEERISFSVTIDSTEYYIIFVPAWEGTLPNSYYFSKKKFNNLDCPSLYPNQEIEGYIKELVEMNVSSILKKYGDPLFINQDIIIYLTGPHRRMYKYLGFNSGNELVFKKNVIGNVKYGFVFFEIENDEVVFAGSMPLFYLAGHGD